MIKPIMKSEFFLRLPSEDAGTRRCRDRAGPPGYTPRARARVRGPRRQHDWRAQTHHLRKGRQQDTPDVQPSNS